MPTQVAFPVVVLRPLKKKTTHAAYLILKASLSREKRKAVRGVRVVSWNGQEEEGRLPSQEEEKK